jgi:hypothetical protein
VLDDFNHADDVVARIGFVRERSEIENPEIIPGSEQISVRPDVVPRELERAALQRAKLSQIFQERPGAAAEVEPAQ